MIRELAQPLIKSNSKRFSDIYYLKVPKIKISKLQAHQKILIKEPQILKRKLKEIRQDGIDEVSIITDFDFTWTYTDFDGNLCDSTFGAIKYSPVITSRLKEQFLGFEREFRNLTEEIDFLESSHLGNYNHRFIHSALARNVSNYLQAIINEKLTIQKLEEVMNSSSFMARHSADGFLKYCFDQSIQLIFCSVGIGNIILPILNQWVDIENYHQLLLTANTLYFSSEGEAIDFRKPILHRYNKPASLINHYLLQIMSREKSYKNMMLIGDRLSDALMDREIVKKNILKVAFCNDRDIRRLNDYCNMFDIVLVNGDFSLNLILLKYMNSELKDSDLDDALQENSFNLLHSDNVFSMK